MLALALKGPSVEMTALGALALFTFTMSVTPGPNNLLLAASGLNFGFRRSLGSLAGIEFGFLSLIVLMAAGLGPLFTAEPRLQTALKVFGVAYLLWLAWLLWRAAELSEAEARRPIGFVRGALLQAVNPKAWLMGAGAVGTFAPPGPQFWPGVAAIVVAFAAIGIPCLIGWTLFGAGIRAVLSSRRALVVFNRIMAALTALTAILVIL
jgi:threonine/homoserine/homoserine lactone efflux protein